jgi:regulator of replication initiation timing
MEKNLMFKKLKGIVIDLFNKINFVGKIKTLQENVVNLLNEIESLQLQNAQLIADNKILKDTNKELEENFDSLKQRIEEILGGTKL